VFLFKFGATDLRIILEFSGQSRFDCGQCLSFPACPIHLIMMGQPSFDKIISDTLCQIAGNTSRDVQLGVTDSVTSESELFLLLESFSVISFTLKTLAFSDFFSAGCVGARHYASSLP